MVLKFMVYFATIAISIQNVALIDYNNTCNWTIQYSQLTCTNVNNVKKFNEAFRDCSFFKNDLSRSIIIQNSQLKYVDVTYLPPHFCFFDSIKMIDSKIETIADDAFESNENVTHLNLSYNNIRDITFLRQPLKKLRELDLSNNKIIAVGCGDLNLLEELKIVKLNDNNIQIICNYQFYNNFLEEFYLHNNKINNLNISIFDKLDNLKILKLHNNPLNGLTTDNQRVNLKVLSLSFHNLKNVSKTDIEELKHVRTLEITNSQLGTVCISDVINSLNPLVYLNNVTIKDLNCESSYNLRLVDSFSEDNNSPYYGDLMGVCVNLSSSSIETVASNAFQYIEDYYKIQQILLENNNIAAVESETFLNFEYLVTVNVSNNRIGELKTLSFKNISFVENGSLDISNNRIEILNSSVFVNIDSVKYINLKNNMINSIETDAFKNVNMHFSGGLLILSGNKLKTLFNNNFKGLANLYELKLDENCLEDIETDAFSGLKNLKAMDLKNNSLVDLDKISFVHTPNLKYLDVSSNKIGFLTLNSFNGLEKLRILKLQNNPMWTLDFEFAKKLTNLNFLSLSSYDVSQAIVRSDLRNLKYLETLQFVDSMIVSVGSAAFLSSKSLRHFYLINTTIQNFDFQAFRDCRLEYVGSPAKTIRNPQTIHLNLSSLSIQSISPGAFQTIDYSNRSFELYLDNNNIYTIEEGIFYELDNLVSLSLTNSRIVNLKQRSFYDLQFLSNSKLNLSNNDIDTLKNHTFINLFDVSNIDLSHNKIEEIEMFAFVNIRMSLFSSLILSHNRLKKLSANNFSGLRSLLNLDVSNNQLESVDKNAFTYLGNLHSIDLRYNNLKILNSESLKSLQYLDHILLFGNDNIFVESTAIRYNNFEKLCKLSSNVYKCRNSNELSHTTERSVPMDPFGWY